MKFSTSIEYAVHGLIYLATLPAGRTAQLGDIAASIEVPEAYLRKVFQQLSRSGILTSQRGARGGFRLARLPDTITLKDVVEAMDGSLPVYSCLREIRGCRMKPPCPVQKVFEKAGLKMGEILDATSIKDLLADISSSRSVAGWLKVTA